jgi:hypothetical protein
VGSFFFVGGVQQRSDMCRQCKVICFQSSVRYLERQEASLEGVFAPSSGYFHQGCPVSVAGKGITDRNFGK